MALQIDKTTDEGFTVSYWRVGPDLYYNVVDQQLQARILPYASATARQADKSAVNFTSQDFDSIRKVVLTGADAINAIKSVDPRDAIYAKVKLEAFFSGAIDV